MGYRIGVSSGIFKAVGEEQKQEYIGLPRKAMFSMYKGVQFNQLDLESISEFQEPDLDKKMEQIRKMGIQYGLHGEVPEYSSAFPRLDQALTDEWKRSHDRMIAEIKGAAKIKAEYILFHASTSDPFLLLWREFQPSNICDIWGRQLKRFLEENPKLLWWALEQEYILVALFRAGFIPTIEGYKKEIAKSYAQAAQAEIAKGKKKEEIKMPSEEEIEKEAREALKERFYEEISTDDPGYGPERVAYYIIAKWMQEGENCPPELHQLWKDITKGGRIEDEKFRNSFGNWVPAVTAAYHWGHFHPEKCPEKREGIEDPKKILEKNKLKVVFETPMAGAGGEEHVRLARVTHIYYMVKAIAHPLVGVAVDAEHMLSANIDPMKDVKELPANAGEKIWVVHVGYPAPLAPAHLPIPLGSEAQMYVYELLFELRKKGMKDAVIIFERGGGQEPVKESILSLRMIVKYLEKDTPPKDLPPDFFGLPPGGPRLTRQLVAIREHALDPLKGLLSVPEEEYGFLSTAAAAKGKLEEWKRRKMA